MHIFPRVGFHPNRVRGVISGTRRLNGSCAAPAVALPVAISAADAERGAGRWGVVCSVNYGTGGSKQILDQIRRMGTNVLIITPAESRVIAGRARTGGAVTTLVERDYSAIRKELLTRTRSSAIVTDSLRIKSGDLSKTTAVLGCEPDYFMIKDWPLLSGQAFDSAQERGGARVAW